jgi:hypothetical protein
MSKSKKPASFTSNPISKIIETIATTTHEPDDILGSLIDHLCVNQASLHQIDIVDRIADNTANGEEVDRFASRLKDDKGLQQQVEERLEMYYSRSRYDRSIQLRLTLFRLSYCAELRWKPKENLFLDSVESATRECAAARKSRQGQTPKTAAVQADRNPQERGGQPGRSPSKGAGPSRGCGGATEEEDAARGGGGGGATKEGDAAGGGGMTRRGGGIGGSAAT